MTLFQNKYRIESTRLKGYDYSKPGAYFITIITYIHARLFGKIINGEMILNNYCKIADKYWREIPQHYLNIQLDKFAIMPNHIHGILIITDKEIEINNKSQPVETIHELSLLCKKI